jgi:hypothetical protein
LWGDLNQQRTPIPERASPAFSAPWPLSLWFMIARPRSPESVGVLAPRKRRLLLKSALSTVMNPRAPQVAFWETWRRPPIDRGRARSPHRIHPELLLPVYRPNSSSSSSSSTSAGATGCAKVSASASPSSGKAWPRLCISAFDSSTAHCVDNYTLKRRFTATIPYIGELLPGHFGERIPVP